MAGVVVRNSRLRRRLTQNSLASKVGVSRSRLADVEAGRGAGLPLETWLALADALEMYLTFEFARDPLEGPADAAHLDERRIEMPGRTGTRWTDVALVKRARRVLGLVECVNTVDNLGDAFRSSDRKLADAAELAVVLGGDGAPFEVGACWVVRDSARNRELLARYRDVFDARFKASSEAWLDALSHGGPMPKETGLVWCDVRATRLCAWRRR